MPTWEEKVGNWFILYGVLMLYAKVASTEFLSKLLFVAIFWAISQKGLLRLGAYLGNQLCAVYASFFQLGSLITVGVLVKTNTGLTLEWWTVLVVFLIASAVFTIVVERHLQEPFPRYGTEALLITSFAVVFLLVHSSFIAVLVVHLATLTVTSTRNIRLITNNLKTPTVMEGTVTWTNNLMFRKERGGSLLLAICQLPSIYWGILAVAVDLVLIRCIP